MDLKELISSGVLQEANRLFFHRIGLALTVLVEDDGTATLAEFLDCRDDPEGVIFAAFELPADQLKADNVAAMFEAKREARIKLLGAEIQPIAREPK